MNVPAKSYYKPEVKRAYYDRNKEEIKAYNRKYWHVNKERWKVSGRNNWLKRNYGISLEQYNELFARQKGCCAICDKHQSEQKRVMAVDHCHSTKAVRGLLCFECNTALGKFRDNPGYLIKAMAYLKAHGKP